MSNIVRGFPNQLMLKMSNVIMIDDEINKMLYYNHVKDKDIYSMPKVENPISTLKDEKVFIDRRIDKVYKESDICIFINLTKDTPCITNGKPSRFIRTAKIEIGVVCHSNCRKMINGIREVVVFDRIVDVLKKSKDIRGIGGFELESTGQILNMPYEYNGYSTILSIDYLNK